MRLFNKNRKKSYLIYLVVGVFLALGFSVAWSQVAQWQDPTCNPTLPAGPGACNAFAPLDVSANDQIKAGGLTMGTLNTTGSAVIGGSLSVLGTFVQFNGVNYTWPSIQGSANQVLANNGSGVLSWVASSAGSGFQNPAIANLYMNGFNINMASATPGNINMAGGTLDMGNGNITNVNKITANIVDPVYEINGSKYATYGVSMIGVNEEIAGYASLTLNNASGQFEYAIDFDKVKEGSDLWVWRQAIAFSKDTVIASLAPYGNFANIYYIINGNKIIFVGDKETEFSYRLTGLRHDYQNYPTKIK